MGKTLRKFSKNGKKTQYRRKTKGRKPIRKKSLRRRKKTGGFQSPSQAIEIKVKEISKLVIKASLKDGSEQEYYKKAIEKLIELTKSGKASCQISRFSFSYEKCELDKINSYGKALILLLILLDKQTDVELNNLIKEIDGSIDIQSLNTALYSKAHRGTKFNEKTLNEYLKSNKKIPSGDYEQDLMNSTIGTNSEWHGLLLNKILMYQFINENPEHYLATPVENPELGLERAILDVQEATEELPKPSEDPYEFTKFPLRAFLLHTDKGDRTIEGYKRRQREIYIEVIEYFTEERDNAEHQILAIEAKTEVIKKKEVEKELNEEQLKYEVAELINWEQKDGVESEEKTEYTRKLGDYNSKVWNKEIERQKAVKKEEPVFN
tara:strand:+ start:888 stop:2024 length:1137 start_codon:yes stop_codon:yes gene_type:complete